MKRILFLIFIVTSVAIIYNFLNSIYRLFHKNDVLVQARQELSTVKKENTRLKEQLVKVKKPEFIEEQSRDKLFLVKPGENTVVIPKNLLPTVTPVKAILPQKPNWEKWREVFWK